METFVPVSSATTAEMLSRVSTSRRSTFAPFAAQTPAPSVLAGKPPSMTLSLRLAVPFTSRSMVLFEM